ncbi:MAG: S-layer homology domain-containing protein [Firmicutes bacterium]|nr:S-layer homology domain-containing protein [Bacillota bacterium]
MKKLLAFVLTLALVLGTVSFAAAAPADDVVGTEYEDAVMRLGALGIMIGDDRGFRPYDSITRAEFAVLVVRALGLEAAAKFSTIPTKFADVTDAYSWAWGYINVATEQGVIKGYSDTAFGPGDAVTYEQAITMIVRALGYEPAVMGGYPAGYLAKAAELGVTDDVIVVAGVGAPRGAVAQMLDNSLEIELMGRTTYGDTTEYTVMAEKTLLNTKLGVTVYEEEEVEDLDKEEREIVIDGDTLKVADGIVIDGLLHATVTAWKYKGIIVYISTDSRVIYDSIDDEDNVTRNDKITLYNAGKTYRTTIDADEVNDMADGQYGKFIINNSRITEAVLYDMTYVRGGMVTSVSTSKEEIKYFVGTGSVRTLRLADADDITVIRDHKVASLGAIKANDIIFVNKTGDDYFIVVTSDRDEGTLTRVTGSAVYVDGTKINETTVASVYYSTDDGDEYSKKTDVDDYDDLLGEDVIVYKDYEGRAIYVVGDVDGVTSDWNYAVFIKYASDINGDLVRLVNTEGKIVTYRVAEDATIKDANNVSISLSDIAEKSITEAGGLLSGDLAGIRYKLNKYGEVSELQEVIADAFAVEADVTDTDKSDDTITVTGFGVTYVTSSTAIFKVVGTKNADIEPVTWSEIENAKSFTDVKAAMYVDSSKSLAKLIIITNNFNQLSDETIYYGYVTAMAKISSDEYELTIDLGEDEEDVIFDKSQVGSGVAVDTVIRYRLNNAGNGISAVKQNGVVEYIYDVDDYFLKFYGDSIYTKVSKNVVVYDEDGDKRDYGDLEDRDGNIANKIRVFKNGSGVIEAIIIEDYTANVVAEVISYRITGGDAVFTNNSSFSFVHNYNGGGTLAVGSNLAVDGTTLGGEGIYTVTFTDTATGLKLKFEITVDDSDVVTDIALQ